MKDLLGTAVTPTEVFPRIEQMRDVLEPYRHDLVMLAYVHQTTALWMDELNRQIRDRDARKALSSSLPSRRSE